MTGAEGSAVPVRQEILEQAIRLTTGDRNKQYGSFAVQAEKLSQIWSVITGQDIRPEHVAPILIAMKLVRMTTSQDQDSEIDLAGYAALHAEHFKTTPRG